ncbi:xanthine dehydrogenase family protein subunit M [Pantoea sp. GD03673]|uniref:FAD binding domain-containing protein n=1 Tax=Pantoea sp. GD03673 TaxID=2975364 RepID=UPI00244D7A25|nr:xanthine dehydrogenase family protein subunit M [Pantoea sp. GD03673]MDH2067181.1 xanthine dehydrogenase family protein subunit M [Pantoea sp. GD03673]
MNEFSWKVARSPEEAATLKQQSGSQLLAGGTTQLDLMKCGVFTPPQLIGISGLTTLQHLQFDDEKITAGALVTMSQLADHPACQQNAPAIYGSLWQAASPHIRNMATLGGNLRQRTRCAYYRDPATFSACNKRNPGSGCAALDGVNSSHAILGASDSCIAVYPGDLAVALVAFDAIVVLQNQQGEIRRLPIDDFFLLPGDTPDREHDLRDDEIIVAIDVPQTDSLRHSHYLKVRDRSSYEFAAASAAAGFTLENGLMRDVHIALGGVATKPWRVRSVEQALEGQPFNEETVFQAAERITQETQALTHNVYKVKLAPRVIARALMSAGETA